MTERSTTASAKSTASVTSSQPSHCLRDDDTPHFSQGNPKNVVIFGDTGVGKSSIINMLAGDDRPGMNPRAKVSSSAGGETFGSVEYHKYLPRNHSDRDFFRVHDTAGINEANTGKVTTVNAIRNLWELLGRLAAGIHLVILVVRGPRLISTCVKNYNLIKALTDDRVPIALVVTGLEGEASLDGWWKESKASFDHHEMFFQGVACITATRGRVINKETHARVYDDVYEQSMTKVEELVLRAATTRPLAIKRKAFLEKRVVDICQFFGWKAPGFKEELHRLLIEYGIERGEAKKLANKVATYTLKARATTW